DRLRKTRIRLRADALHFLLRQQPIHQRARRFCPISLSLVAPYRRVPDLRISLQLRKRAHRPNEHPPAPLRQQYVPMPSARPRLIDILLLNEVIDMRLPVLRRPVGRHLCAKNLLKRTVRCLICLQHRGSDRHQPQPRGLQVCNLPPQQPDHSTSSCGSSPSLLFARACFSPICSSCRRQSNSSTNPRDALHSLSTFTNNSRNTLVPSSASISLRAAVPMRFSISPPRPIRIAFCPERSQKIAAAIFVTGSL